MGCGESKHAVATTEPVSIRKNSSKKSANFEIQTQNDTKPTITTIPSNSLTVDQKLEIAKNVSKIDENSEKIGEGNIVAVETKKDLNNKPNLDSSLGLKEQQKDESKETKVVVSEMPVLKEQEKTINDNEGGNESILKENKEKIVENGCPENINETNEKAKDQRVSTEPEPMPQVEEENMKQVTIEQVKDQKIPTEPEATPEAKEENVNEVTVEEVKDQKFSTEAESESKPEAVENVKEVTEEAKVGTEAETITKAEEESVSGATEEVKDERESTEAEVTPKAEEEDIVTTKDPRADIAEN